MHDAITFYIVAVTLGTAGFVLGTIIGSSLAHGRILDEHHETQVLAIQDAYADGIAEGRRLQRVEGRNADHP